MAEEDVSGKMLCAKLEAWTNPEARSLFPVNFPSRRWG